MPTNQNHFSKEFLESHGIISIEWSTDSAMPSSITVRYTNRTVSIYRGEDEISHFWEYLLQN